MQYRLIKWYGKNIEDCTKEELIECIKYLNDTNLKLYNFDYQKEKYKTKEEKIKILLQVISDII
jgi:hypothetical protein